MAKKKTTTNQPPEGEQPERRKQGGLQGAFSTIQRRVERQAKQDEVLESGLHYYEWTASHFKWILAVAVVIFLAWGVYYGIETTRTSSLETSEQLLAEAQEFRQSEQTEQMQAALNSLFTEYSNTRAARYGHALMGEHYMEQDQYAQAREQFQIALDGATPSEKAHFSISVAKTWESEGDHEQAVGVYRNALNSWPDTVWEDALRFHLAQALERIGEDEEALEQYKAIAADSSWYVEAKSRIDWLEAPVPTLAPAGGELAS